MAFVVCRKNLANIEMISCSLVSRRWHKIAAILSLCRFNSVNAEFKLRKILRTRWRNVWRNSYMDDYWRDHSGSGVCDSTTLPLAPITNWKETKMGVLGGVETEGEFIPLRSVRGDECLHLSESVLPTGVTFTSRLLHFGSTFGYRMSPDLLDRVPYTAIAHTNHQIFFTKHSKNQPNSSVIYDGWRYRTITSRRSDKKFLGFGDVVYVSPPSYRFDHINRSRIWTYEYAFLVAPAVRYFGRMNLEKPLDKNAMDLDDGG